MKIVFRTNAGKEGLGHLNRIYSLYTALKKQEDFIGKFLVNNSARDRLLKLDIPLRMIEVSESYNRNDINTLKSFSPDIVIIDTYKASQNYLLSIKQELPTKLVMFDDNNLFSDIEVDILINGNIYAKNLNYNSEIKYKKALLGPEYLVMNPDYWNEKQEIPNQIENILVTCGGADPVNLMPQLADWLKQENIKKKLVIGPYFTQKDIQLLKKKIDETFKLIWKPVGLKEEIIKSDIVLTAAGSTIYEVLSLKRIPIIYTIGEDQLAIAKELEKQGIINLGWYEEMNKAKIKKALNKARKDSYHSSFNRLYEIFDGKGAERVAKEIIDIAR